MRCSTCWAVWLRWHQPCHQSWLDWHRSGGREILKLIYWYNFLVVYQFILNKLGTLMRKKTYNYRNCLSNLPKFQWFPWKSLWWCPKPGRKRSSQDPNQCSGQAQSHHRGRWLQHGQLLVPGLLSQQFSALLCKGYIQKQVKHCILRFATILIKCLKPYVPGSQVIMTDRDSEETCYCLQGERQHSTTQAAL